MKGLIVEDEKLAMDRMVDLIDRSNLGISIVDKCSLGEEAIQSIQNNHPDVIFLDIQLPDMNGFEVLNQIDHNPYVIFTTAYHEYALKAFKFHSIDYLLKPIDQDSFNGAVQKLLDLQAKTAQVSFKQMTDWMNQNRPDTSSTFTVKLRDRILLLNFEDIAYFKSEDKYVEVALKNGQSHLTNKTLTQLEIEVPASFYRVHRSYIINRNYVVEMQKYFKGRYVLKLNDKKNTSITTGEVYLHRVKEIFDL